MFRIGGTSDRFWNKTEFVKFLVDNQHKEINITVDPEAICLRSLGVYDLLDMFEFKSVTVHTWNPLESHDQYTVHLNGANFWFDRTADIDTNLHQWDLSHVFLCMYHRPTAGRLGIASYASQYNTLMHFSSDHSPDELVQYELDKLLQYDVASVARAGEFLQNLPILQSSRDKLTKFNGYDYRDPLTALYRKCFVDLVVESHTTGQTFFPTEKTIRPILLKKPFIVFGSVSYLDYLHQMGFRTFSDFWDEDYDGYEKGDRLCRIYSLIDSIAKMPINKLETMYYDMQYSLDHNYNLLMNKTFNRTITPI